MERAARLIKNTKHSNSILSDDDIARAIWPTAVGKAIATHTLRVKVVRSTLVVEMEDAIWQRQLFPLTAQIITRLQNVLGSDLIRDIEFRVGAPRRQPARAAVRDTLAQPQPALIDEADSIQDPVLKNLYRLSRKKATA